MKNQNFLARESIHEVIESTQGWSLGWLVGWSVGRVVD